jgi:type I restriction enzyme M protein
VRALDDDGVELNAEFSVQTDGPHLSLVLESAGGRSIGTGRPRNDQYVSALRLLLRRLGDRNAVLVSALVVSKTVADLPEAGRTILSGPLNLAEVTDYEELRLRLTTPQGAIGRLAGATKPGNNRKRLQLRLDLPGYGSDEADRLAADLAAAPTPPPPVPARGRPARSSSDAWTQIQAICREAMSNGRTIATIDKGIANRILDVRPSAIVRASDEARTPDGKGAQVTRTMIEHIWRALATDGHAGRIRGALFFAYALVAEIPGVAVDDDRRGIHIADWDLAMTPFGENSEATAIPARRYWTLASHPARYRVVDAVRELDEDWWLTGGADIHAGDRIAVWKYKGSDDQRGIIAFGEVLTNPEVRDLSGDEHTYWIDPDLKAAAPRVRVRYVIRPSEPLWLEGAPAGSVIRQLPVSRAQGGTAHHVTPDQWEQLMMLAGGWPSPDAGGHDRAPYRGRPTVGFDFQKLWDFRNVLRDEGLSYQDFLEQLTFLLFLKMADEQTELPVDRQPIIPHGLDWDSLVQLEGDSLAVQYGHILSELSKYPGMLGVIFRKAQNKIQDPAKLRHLVTDLIGREQWMALDTGVMGDVYEELLAKNAQDVGSGAGQYFTPRVLTGMIVDVMRPDANTRVCDPAAGTGGFLLAAYEQIKQGPLDPDQKRFLHNEAFRGWEILDTTARLCTMNLLLHGISAPESPPVVTVDDALRSAPSEHFDMVLTNPPFGSRSSYREQEDMSYLRKDFWVSTSSKELNFLQHVRSLLTINGRAAVVVPDNVLFGGGAAETVRRKLLTECDVHTLLRLPVGIFYPGAVKANVLFFDRKPPSEKPWTDKLWIYDFRTNQRFTPKTRVLARGDLDDFVACYNPANRHERSETERFRAFTYADLISRDKASLDISSLKDTDGKTSIPAFEYVARGDLDSYIREFADASPELEAALSAGRLPFPSVLAERSRDLAWLAARIWAVTSTDSPAYRHLFEVNRQLPDALLPGTALTREPERAAEESKLVAEQSRRSHPQAEGARLENGMLRIFERLFRIEADDWQAETSGSRRRRAQVRRQQSGTQYGADIVVRFKGAAIRASSTCLVECKNYAATASRPTVSTVADKLLQAQDNFDAEPVDHWILISPNLDPNNELDRMVERWNATQLFPFTVQIWSPQTGIRELFTIDPDIYRSLYDEDPPESRRDPADILADFSERLRPPVRLPERLRRYVQDQRSFVEPSKREWLDQLTAQIERFGFDEKGAHLGRPLEAEILSVLVDSPEGSNVALLLADFGEGKSFFTVSLCIRLRDRYLKEPQSGSPIPVRLHLRGYRDVSAPADFLRTQLEFLGLSMEDWAELRRGQILVVLDGLDEMSVRLDPATTRANLDKIGPLLELLEGLPVLVTSRPHFFASDTDRERFYDRLRRPHVFRMAQPDPRDTKAHLRAYANSLDLEPKLNKIENLYDPIGLAGKVLFLEMIKKTLPDLPEDHFDELVLYETYVKNALDRKIDLIRDPDSAINDADLLDRLKELLEKIAVAIHVSGEGSVDLREFAAQWGGAAQLLWRASQLGREASSDDDASARIGSRSLLRRVSAENDDRWLVDFFHRSMKEYFVAKAFRRALNSPDAFATTRELLLRTPVQPEILGFFRLLADTERDTPVLASLAYSARIGSGQGILGGGAISLYHAAGGQFRGSDWRSLQLDSAILVGADLSGINFRGSTLRAADLSSTNLSGADLASADLTGAKLDAGGSVIGLTPDAAAHRFLCLTEDCELGRINKHADSSLKLSVNQLPRTLRRPENVYLLREDLVLVTAHSEFLIADIGGEIATEVAYFRVSGDLRDVAVVDRTLLGLLFEPENGASEALLIDIESGQVRWRIPVQPGSGACGWFKHGVVMTSGQQLLLFRNDGTISMVHGDIKLSVAAICVHDDQVILLAENGRQVWLPLEENADLERTIAVHDGAGTSVTATTGSVLSSGTDGSVVLTRRNASGAPKIAARVERRLRCTGAHIKNMKSEREVAIFIANGADRRS